jgi:prolyl-tRNA editing enzyme YbaK/EbsC (Cys-tRNA(Pro) deacylase)
MKNTIKRDSETATRVKRTAEICGVSPRQVYRVIMANQVNEEVMKVFMHLDELEKAAVDIAKKTSLIKEAENTVPFNN